MSQDLASDDGSAARRAARSIEERRPGQLVQVHALPAETPLAYIARALMVNQALLFADLFRGESAGLGEP